MKFKLLCILGLSTLSMFSIAGGNHDANSGGHAPHTENEAKIAKENHKELNNCSRKGISMLMELDKFLVIPTEDEKEISRFLSESAVINTATEKERDLFLRLAAKKNQEGMSSAKVKKLFAEAIVQRCK